MRSEWCIAGMRVCAFVLLSTDRRGSEAQETQRGRDHARRPSPLSKNARPPLPFPGSGQTYTTPLRQNVGPIAAQVPQAIF